MYGVLCNFAAMKHVSLLTVLTDEASAGLPASPGTAARRRASCRLGVSRLETSGLKASNSGFEGMKLRPLFWQVLTALAAPPNITTAA